MIIDNRAIRAAALAVLSLIPIHGAAGADSLDHLERERGHVLELMFDPGITIERRIAEMPRAEARLADLERYVLSDRSLSDDPTPAKERALRSYDLTFMVHAASVTGLSLTEHWLEQIGVTTEAILSARRTGR